MQIHTTPLAGLLVFEPTTHSDARGSLMEAWHAERYRAAGLPDFVQDNVSRSHRLALRGLHYQLENQDKLRGLHYQIENQDKLGSQGKLVTVLSGSAFDVAVDLRRDSPTFRRWFGIALSGDHLRQVWIPSGFAHGLLATSETMVVHYKLTEGRVPELERVLRWDDPSVDIDWPLAAGEEPILSERDRDAPTIDHIELP